MKNKSFFHVKAKDLPNISELDDAIFNAALNGSYNVFAQNRPRMIKRLNAYDTELLEDVPVAKIDADVSFNSQNKIQELDNRLKKIDEQIKFSASRNDEISLKELHVERYRIMRRIDELKGVSEKIISPDTPYGRVLYFVVKIADKVSDKKRQLNNFVKDNIVSKMMQPFSKAEKLKDILSTLNTLNGNVSELCSLRIPYGEQEMKYEELAKYLSQATSIQSLIKKEMRR